MKTIPTLAEAYARAEPVYEEWPGWQTDTPEAGAEEELPRECPAYIARLEELLGAEIVLVGVGQQRRQLVRRGSYAPERRLSPDVRARAAITVVRAGGGALDHLYILVVLIIVLVIFIVRQVRLRRAIAERRARRAA